MTNTAFNQHVPSIAGRWGLPRRHVGIGWLVALVSCVFPFVVAIQPASGNDDENVVVQMDVYSNAIVPILKAKCWSCHGPLKQASGLRLDTISAMRQGGDSGDVIVAGRADQSELIRRVIGTSEDERMPPEGEPLTERQIGLLRTWIDAGARGSQHEAPPSDPASHWAYQPLASMDRPDGDVHPVDALVHAHLKANGIRQASRADAHTLIRRMFLDLHGLLPTPDDVALWGPRIQDDPRATKQLIDALLASPRYGERWAQHWLDVVRYADTDGFEVNTPRPNAWPYRDYVIKAFNQDKPYDDFVRDQIIGDQRNEHAATGFLVAAAALLPGQIGKDDASKRLARQDALDEIVVGTTATFLATTVGCARCHDHKFDPVSQRDYYAMQAFFAGVEYGEREIRDDAFEARLRRAEVLKRKLEPLRRQIDAWMPLAFPGRTIVIDDEDTDRVSVLHPINGHGENPKGTQRGYRDDPGTDKRIENLSTGRYTWWPNQPGLDVFTWNPKTSGSFHMWVSWGTHGSGVHTRDARYVIDADGDLSTKNDQQEIARADQYYFAGVDQGQTERRPMWSGLHYTGIHHWQESSRLVLRGGETGAGITADVLVMQEVVPGLNQGPADSDASIAGQIGSMLPRLREPVNAAHNVERFHPVDAKFIRFTTSATIDGNKHEPCLDELEVYSPGSSTNLALSANGTTAASSGNYSDVGKHRLQHINDGRYGNDHSWISNQHGGGWVQLELPRVAKIDRIEWGRDRTGKFRDRLALRYQIDVSLDGVRWKQVTSSADRVRFGSPHDSVTALLRHVEGDRVTARDLVDELRRREQAIERLQQPQRVWAGVFRTPDQTYRLQRGDPEQPAEPVQPCGLSILGAKPLPDDLTEQQRRNALAQWIASPSNPLTPRVIVNRIWQYHFGTGLVATPSDFGLNGEPPSHPELLDFLANYLIAHDWSIKSLHRLIMTSQTYQQRAVWDGATDSTVNPNQIDATNRWLWRYPSRRMEAEAIRDCILQAAGQLNLEVDGPGFDFFQSRGGLSGFPPVTTFGATGHRRMIYAHKIRMERVPIFGAFDCPDAGLPTPRRSRSTTAIQALNLFNSPFVIEKAQRFAQRVRNHSCGSTESQIDLAFRIALGRPPTGEEWKDVLPVVRTHGLATLCRVLFNSNEFLLIP